MEAVKVDNLRGFETMHGLIVGTPPYISPEQARGDLEHIDPRSDVYVLGEILYTILTLRAPIAGDDLAKVVENILSSRIVPPSTYNQPAQSSRRKPEELAAEPIVLAHCPGRRIPDGLSAVVMKALQLEPAERYQCVEDLQADIAAFQGGFAPKAQRAGPAEQVRLFTARHKAEVALFGIFFIVFNIIIASFFIQIRRERDRAKESEASARESAKLAAERLAALRGTAPTFFEEAQQLVDDGRFGEALDKIDYAIQQVPNDAAYHNLRGNILQAQLRLDEAGDAFEEALKINPNHKEAKLNLDLTKKFLTEIGTDEQIKPAILADLYAALLNQGRRSAAENVQSALGPDKQRFVRLWRDAFDRRGMRQQRFETNADGTINVDFAKVPQPDLGKLRGIPVTGLILDDTKITDLSGLRGLQLQNLSLSHTVVRDLAALEGMPLRSLNIEATAVHDLTPLRALPLASLRMSSTRVRDLSPLSGTKIEQLFLTGCHLVHDLTPLRGLPLQTLALNRTGVTDITPLTQSPLRELNLEGCTALTDLKPLMDIATLESVLIPTQCKDIGFLRKHPGIKRISYTKMTQPAAEFWAEFDAAPAAADKPNPAP
jgi:tetratricopeptide (TPR) repeat protein